jgi:hypothetical protein
LQICFNIDFVYTFITMKKYLILVYIPFFLISCKKNNTPATINVVGKWTLYSIQGVPANGSPGLNVTQYPCLSNNVLQLNADNTAITSYDGKDTCYVSPGNGTRTIGESEGYAGQTPNTSKWRRSGNDIYIGAVDYALSSSNGKLYLTATETLGIPQGYNPSIVIRIVEIKE